MTWFNPYGFVFILLIMIPNIVFAVKCRDGFENLWHSRMTERLEQIGRYGCFITMICNVPFTVFGFSSDDAFAVYWIVDSVLAVTYCLIWIVCFRKETLFRALSLSILPSVLFLFSGVMSRSVLLTAAAVLFAPCHILLSYKNAVLKKKNKQGKQNRST